MAEPLRLPYTAATNARGLNAGGGGILIAYRSWLRGLTGRTL
jgi:hypothetical protein